MPDDRFLLTMGGVDYWIEGGTWDEMSRAAISMMKTKFVHRRQRPVSEYSPAESAAMLRPYRLFRTIDRDERIGELVSPANS